MVAWILGLAPGGGPSFPEEDLYGLLQYDCSLPQMDGPEAERFASLSSQTRSLYEGAAAACQAAFYGQAEKWQIAESALAQIDAGGADFSCLGDVVYEALRELVAVHTADPAAQLERRDGSAREPACPRVISVEPDHGPASGGYSVQLVGQHLPATSVIHFGDVDLTVQTDGVSASLIVPAAPDDVVWSAGTYEVLVWIDGWYKYELAQALFVYELEEEPNESSVTEATPPTTPGG